MCIVVGLKLRKGRTAEEEGGGGEGFSWFTDDDG